jgi:hypothetical protein
MKKKTDNTQKTINDYINNNALNSRIYQVLLNFQDSGAHCRNKLKKPPLEIFDMAYSICDELQNENHPEEQVSQIFDRLRTQKKVLLCEANVVFSCVYVILFFSDNPNPYLCYSLNRIKQTIDKGYLGEFEQLINDELTHIATTTDCFEDLKVKADKILDLTKRKLFYNDFLTHYKQTHNKQTILEKISEEVDNIQLKIDLSTKTETTEIETIENDEIVDVAFIKVRLVLLMELFKGGVQISPAIHDRTKISRLAAFLTGSGYHKVLKDLQTGIRFSERHHAKIDEANQILSDLKIPISIDKAKPY